MSVRLANRRPYNPNIFLFTRISQWEAETRAKAFEVARRTREIMLRSFANLALVFLMCGFCFAQSANGARLRERAKSYYDAFAQKRFQKMWEMSSQKLHDGNDNDKKSYVEYIKRYDLSKVKTEIVSTEIRGDQAKVKVKIN